MRGHTYYTAGNMASPHAHKWPVKAHQDVHTYNTVGYGCSNELSF